MTNLTRIVAAVVDTKQVTLYKTDGETIVILQGDTRLRAILEYITPRLSKEGGYADIDLTPENSWKAFEEKTNGAVRLFRIAKSKLASIFKPKEEQPTFKIDVDVIGRVPRREVKESVAVKNMAAVDEIMKHAVPVSDAAFNEHKVAEQRPTANPDGGCTTDRVNDGRDGYFDKAEDTIVAITPKGNVVAGVERIKSQFAGAAETGEVKGMTLFLERIAAVASRRKHTVDDLLRFMERGDLPVANDGTIVIYKRLWRDGDHYVDPHSRRVTQRVGSYVHMDEKMVDPNRRNECSNGLHVGRRSYMGGFSGDVICLAKVRPEDVIAVPDYDANKMRVCGYHLIAELTPAQFKAIVSNRPITEAEGGAELLGKAITGDHIGITEEVKIGGASGTQLTITKIQTGEEQPEPATQAEAIQAEEATSETEPSVETPGVQKAKEDAKVGLKPAVVKKKVSKSAKKAQRKAKTRQAVAKQAQVKRKALEAVSGTAGDVPVDVKAVQKLKEGVATDLAVEPKPMVTQIDVVKALWDEALRGNRAKAQELLDFKKKAKKGWSVWGLPETAGDTLKALL